MVDQSGCENAVIPTSILDLAARPSDLLLPSALDYFDDSKRGWIAVSPHHITILGIGASFARFTSAIIWFAGIGISCLWFTRKHGKQFLQQLDQCQINARSARLIIRKTSRE
ncbi:unnamed protein product [Sphagnum tenellum]